MPIRVKTRLARRKKLLYEIGVAIVALTVLLGVLSTVTMSSKTVIVDTRDLLASTITIRYGGYNTTSDTLSATLQVGTYNLSDLATLYNGTLYISIPAPPAFTGYDVSGVIAVAIPLNLTFAEMVEHGVSKIEVHIELLDYSLVKPQGTLGVAITYADDPNYYAVTSRPIYIGELNTTTGTIDANITVDPMSLLLKATSGNYLNKQAMLVIFTKLSQITGVKLRFKVYGVSEKPVLAIYAEPVYAAVTAVVSALYAAARRIQQYALSAFGGLSLATLFSGLTGNAIVAMVLAIVFFIVMVELRKKR